MSKPIEVDLPHSLGREEAHRRIADNVHKLGDHMPGGVAEVTSQWQGDRLDLSIGAMGQEVKASIDVRERDVHVVIDLPGMLALFATPIEAALRKKGSDLLLEDKRNG